LLTFSDISYVDKAKREAVEDKRKADAQIYDISYVDKKRDAEAEADAQIYDISYVGTTS
jgi:hypothetical protein